MNQLWNSNIFSVTGGILAPEAPPELRIEGGVATAAQLTAANNLFQGFVQAQRYSYVPNPMQAGNLPDGSLYRITKIGPQVIMQLWPVQVAEKSKVRGVNGIKVVLAQGDIWLVMPSKAWAKESHQELFAGAGYCQYRPGRFFVESPSGVAMGGKKKAAALQGMQPTIYVGAIGQERLLGAIASKQPIASAPFMTGNFLCQVKADANGLLLKHYRVGDDAAIDEDSVKSVSITVVPPDGATLGLTTADKDFLMACCIKDRSILLGPAFTFVVGVLERATAVDVDLQNKEFVDVRGTGVELTPPNVTDSAPDLDPQTVRHARSTSQSSGTTSVTHQGGSYQPPYSQSRTADVYRSSSENLRQAARHVRVRGVSKAYILGGDKYRDQLDVTDSVTHNVQAITQLSDSGDSFEFVERIDNYTYLETAKTDRSAVVTIDGVGEITLCEAVIDYVRSIRKIGEWRRQYGGVLYNSSGGVKGWWYSETAQGESLETITATAKVKREVVLFADAALGVSASIRAGAEFSFVKEEGWPALSGAMGQNTSDDDADIFDFVVGTFVTGGGNNFKPEALSGYNYISSTTETPSETPAMLVLRSRAGTQQIALTPFLGVELPNKLKQIITTLTNEGGSFGRYHGQVTGSYFTHEGTAINALAQALSTNIGGVRYATDPISKSGFLSFVWMGSTHNYAVDAGGFTSSISQSGIPSNAAVTEVLSV